MGYPVRLNDNIAKNRSFLDPLPQLTVPSRALQDFEEHKATAPRVAKEVLRTQAIRARSKRKQEQPERKDSQPSATEVRSANEDLNVRSDLDEPTSESTQIEIKDADMRPETDEFDELQH